MKTKSILLTWLLLFVASIALHARVFETKQSGTARDPKVWGVPYAEMPKSTDDVIIRHEVECAVYDKLHVRHLTIETGGCLKGNSLRVEGNLVNRGQMGKSLTDLLRFALLGNLFNEGQFYAEADFRGNNQEISSSQPLQGALYFNYATGKVKAQTDLVLRNARVQSVRSATFLGLDMGEHKLSLLGDKLLKTQNGTYPPCYAEGFPIYFKGVGHLQMNKAYLATTHLRADSLVLESPDVAYVREGTEFHAPTTLWAGKFQIRGGWNSGAQVVFHQGLFNYARINADSIHADTVAYATSPTYHFGSFNVKRQMVNRGAVGWDDQAIVRLPSTCIYLVGGEEQCSISGTYYCDIECRKTESWIDHAKEKEGSPGQIVVKDFMRLGSGVLRMFNVQLHVLPQATLHVSSDNWYAFGSLSPHYYPLSAVRNEGSIKVDDLFSWRYYGTADYSNTLGILFRTDKQGGGSFKGTYLEAYGGAHPALPSTVKQWWRLSLMEGEETECRPSFTFHYDETKLNGHNEKDLRLYQSLDGGKTWRMVSYGDNYQLDTEKNTFTMWHHDEKKRVQGLGDFVLSSGEGHVPLASKVKVELVARESVRVGAPNRATIHLYNLDNAPSSALNVMFQVGDKIRIHSAEIPSKNGMVKMPLEELRDPEYDKFDAYSDKSQLFYVHSLAPYEERSFDIIYYGIPSTNTRSQEIDEILEDLEISPTDFGVTLIEDYVQDKIVDYVKEKADLEEEEIKNWERYINPHIRQCMAEERQKDGMAVTACRTVTKYIGTKVLESLPTGTVISKVGEAVETVYSMKDALRRRLWYWIYKEVGLFGVETLDGKYVNGQPVTSWDPNEMVGPLGVGKEHHVADGGLMQYTILFENKREATAPAYRVRIKNELDPRVFRPETVKFGATSHEGAQYVWKMKREGNTLYWDIEGIELPPNVTVPEGEGYVSYTVETQPNLPNGTVIANAADIVFDENPTIRTNTYTNPIDREAPVSVVSLTSYAPQTKKSKISVKATDTQSGVAFVDVYVSQNSGMFTKLGSITGEEGEVEWEVPASDVPYRFYAIATDRVGNVENKVNYLNVSDVTLSIVQNKADAVAVAYEEQAEALVLVSQDETLGVEIYSLSGQKLTGQRLGKGHHRLSAHGWPAGVYVVRLKGKHLKHSHKFVKH